MKLSTATHILSVAAVASAVPAPAAAPEAESSSAVAPFGVMSLRSASPIHFGQLSAALGSIFIHLPQQNATCEGDAHGTATFYVQDGELFLYGKEDSPVQQVYVDRSGMGQGKVGYITADEQPPRNAELTGWTVDENENLLFAEESFAACPNSIDGAWSVWAGSGFTNPGGNEGCLGLSARTVPLDAPVACEYSS